MYAFKNYGVVITPEEAEALIDKFFELYTAIKPDHEAVLEELEETGSVDRITLSGRRRDDITNRNEAINAPIQGSSADGLKMAMTEVHKRLRKFEGTAFIVASLHDELLIECNEVDAEEAEKRIKQAMLEAMNKLVNTSDPKVPIKITGDTTKVWSKD
jgi:DNA polymerase-1